MAIDMNQEQGGGGQEYTSKGKGNAALTLGIVGTALAAMNGGVLGGGGLFGGNRNTDACLVGYREYAADQMAMQRQYCELAQRVAINETANNYQNRISDIQFANVDNRFSTEQIINDLTLKLATCNVVKGKPMITEFGSPVRMSEGMLRTTPVGYTTPILDTFSDCGC